MTVPQGVWELRTLREYIADIRDEDKEWDEETRAGLGTRMRRPTFGTTQIRKAQGGTILR